MTLPETRTVIDGVNAAALIVTALSSGDTRVELANVDSEEPGALLTPSQLAQLRAAIASPSWRKEPPTVDEVKVHAWWWRKPANGNPPHVLHLDVGADKVIYIDEELELDPDDWPGEWAPAVPPP